MCEDSASFDLTSTDISLCINDINTILKAKKEEQELSTQGMTHSRQVACDVHVLYVCRSYTVILWGVLWELFLYKL